MKNKTLIALACFFLMGTNIVIAKELASSQPDVSAAPKDSVVFKFVRQLALLVEDKNQSKKVQQDKMKDSSVDSRHKQQVETSASNRRSKGLKDYYGVSTNISKVCINSMSKEVPLEELVGMNAEKLDSVCIILDKSPQARAIFGRRTEQGIMMLFFNSTSDMPTSAPIFNQPRGLKKDSSNLHEGNKTLVPFVEKLCAIINKSNIIKTSEGANGACTIVVRGQEPSEIKNLNKYDLDDVANITITLKPGEASQQKEGGLVFLTMYRDVFYE